LVDKEVYLRLKSQVFGEEDALSSPARQAHLTIEQKADYIDETLTGEELQAAEDHLTYCEECERTVNDLRTFKDQVAPELNYTYKPSRKPTAAENRRRLWGAVLSFFRTKSPALVSGMALAALLLTVTGRLLWQALHGINANPVMTPPVHSPKVSSSLLPSPTPEDTAAIVIAQLNDGGGQVTLDRVGNLSGVDHLPAAYQQIVKSALINQRLERSPLLAGLTQPGKTPRNGDDDRGRAVSVIEPVGKVSLSDRPTFSWSQLDGASASVVEVYDEEFTLAATSPQINDHSWTAPQPLKRGGIYSWQVKAIKDGQTFVFPRLPAPPAKFLILDQAKVNELRRARRVYSSWRLVLGLLYVQAGLIDEAELELRALQKSNPNSSIPRQLLTQVEAMRRS
jgi:hypothetical protein